MYKDNLTDIQELVLAGMANEVQENALWEELINEACVDLACGAGFCSEYPEHIIALLEKRRNENFFEQAKIAFAQSHAFL